MNDMSTRYTEGDKLYEKVRGIALDHEKPGGTGWPHFLVTIIMEMHDRLVESESKL